MDSSTAMVALLREAAKTVEAVGPEITIQGIINTRKPKASPEDLTKQKIIELCCSAFNINPIKLKLGKTGGIIIDARMVCLAVAKEALGFSLTQTEEWREVGLPCASHVSKSLKHFFNLDPSHKGDKKIISIYKDVLSKTEEYINNKKK